MSPFLNDFKPCGFGVNLITPLFACNSMLDGLKMRCPYLDPIRWFTCPALTERDGFPLSVVEPTGEIQRKPRVAAFQGLLFAVSPSTSGGYRCTVTGSLHKYHNLGKGNSDRFTVEDAQKTIANLAAQFGIEPEKTPLEGLEIGVNLNLPFAPVRIIKAAIAHHGKPYAPINPRKPTLGKLCSREDYEIKLYDKGRQAAKKSDEPIHANLLRIEVKVRKMRLLEQYGIATLKDLTNAAKIRPLIDLLTEAIDGTIFIDPLANLNQLSIQERETVLSFRNPDAWTSENLSRRMRAYYRQQLPNILRKCNAYEYAPALRNWVIEEWQALTKESLIANLISPINGVNEAVINVTFSPLVCVSANVTVSPFAMTRESSIYFLPEILKNRTCQSCGKLLNDQKTGSRFCSEKYNGRVAARRCRNKDSNLRRTKRNQIMKAQTKNQFLRITYLANGQTYTDTLCSSKIAVTREWLDQILMVEVIPICGNTETTASDSYGCCHCPPETLTGSKARQRLETITSQNTPTLNTD